MRDGWRTVTLGDVLVRRTERLGDAPEPRILTVTEGHGLVDQIAHMGRRVATEDVSKYKPVRPGDLAYNVYLLWLGAIGQNTSDDMGVTSPVYEVFSPSPDVNPRYLGLVTRSPRMLESYGTISIGTVPRRRRAPWDAFLQLPVLLPPHDVQRRIVDLIGSLDEAIMRAGECADSSGAILEHLRMIEATNDSEFLGDLATMRSGPSWKSQDESDRPGTGLVPVLGITNTPSGSGISLEPRKFVSGLPQRTQRLTPRSLVMIRTNGNRSRIGNVYRATPDVEGHAVSAFQIAIEPLDGVDPAFLYWYIGSRHVQDLISDKASGTTGLGNISIGELKKLPIPTLSLDPPTWRGLAGES